VSDDGEEGGPAVARVEAFSDGVIAIIITIMVLELHAPARPGWAPLLALWPVFLAYMLSFAYVGIYWVNHHQLFGHARRVTNGLVWFNLLLLFALSLVPFSTAYMGEQHFSRDAVLVYLVSMILPAFAYIPLQAVIARTGTHGEATERYLRRAARKGGFAVLVYAAGLPLSFVTPWLGVASAAVVAIIWFLPTSALDQLFEN
jgi:uncharacterized membrane protein